MAFGSTSQLSEIYKEAIQHFVSQEVGQTIKKNATYVLLHTFAHNYKELSMQCGYSSASIKRKNIQQYTMCGYYIQVVLIRRFTRWSCRDG